MTDEVAALLLALERQIDEAAQKAAALPELNTKRRRRCIYIIARIHRELHGERLALGDEENLDD